MTKRILCILLSLMLLLSLSAPGLAAETKQKEAAQEAVEIPEKKLTISNLQQFLTFAENCRLDSYSLGLTVQLKTDLDLSDKNFESIPIFCGTFLGNGHTISGLTITGEGSQLGLFRYLTPGSLVKNLQVKGTIQPGGTQEVLGGIAGSNSGHILDCSFDGIVAGSSAVGGLAGENTVTGIIESCRVRGQIQGSHFVGGVAGENQGVIRDCVNYASVNTTAKQNTVSLTDMTLESMVSTETAATVTDIGGIAGISTGLIRTCGNRGDVGYQHMGYNIGGIAGTQSGFLTQCNNWGTIHGRKEVGGIVGQMEPSAFIEYEEDALQILKDQLGSMTTTISKTASNVQSTGQALYGQVYSLQEHVHNARESVELLVPDPENPGLPDKDSLEAAKNGLSSSISGMVHTMESMEATTFSAMGTLNNNLNTLKNQVGAMSSTLNNAAETLGGSLEDVSDQDTPETLTGKVSDCCNYGTVLGDLNIGGIAGAMAMENDLDMEEDFQILGNNSLNFTSQLRSVILDCENQGTVTAGKRAAGGIAGWQSLGLVRNCRNTGKIEAASAQYVGGIAGQSTGYIRSSSANCLLSGSSFVGGIAGSASIATDCRSLVRLETGSENLGAILGGRENNRTELENPISGNYYLSLKDDIGAIDGISYDGQAQPLIAKDFFALDGLPEVFDRALVTFRFADGTKKQIRVDTGGRLTADQIPQLPEIPGTISHWEGLKQADLSQIYFDLSFEAVYTSLHSAIESDLQEAGLPVMLLQGQFGGTTTLTVTPGQWPDTPEEETVLGAWDFRLSQEDPVTTLRLRIPDGSDSRHLLARLNIKGQWQTVPLEVSGSYAVISMVEGAEAVSLSQVEDLSWYLPAAIGGVLAVVLVMGLVRRKKTGKQEKPVEKISDFPNTRDTDDDF